MKITDWLNENNQNKLMVMRMVRIYGAFFSKKRTMYELRGVAKACMFIIGGRMKKLSPRQKEIYDFIAAYVDENKISPTIDEIGDYLLLSNSTVNTYISLIKAKGWLTSREHCPRSFRIVQQEQR